MTRENEIIPIFQATATCLTRKSKTSKKFATYEIRNFIFDLPFDDQQNWKHF